MSKVAFLGMGVMGYPMAGHIAAAGHDVTVYNRTPAKAEAWAGQHGGAFALTPAAAARDADFVFCCVGDDPDVLSVALGDEGAIPAMKNGAVFIDNSTVSADVARQVYSAAKAAGISSLDAPVSGGQAGAENGKLTVMVGGDDAAFAAALPLMECYGARVVHMGDAGKGQQAKMVNQICIAGLVQGLSEGINFAQRAGLDVGSVVDTISKGAAGSWQMENRAQTMADGVFDYGFALDWMRKDLRICFEEAAANGSVLPVTEIVDGYYEQLQELGLGRWDTSTLIHLLRQE